MGQYTLKNKECFVGKNISYMNDITAKICLALL